MQRISQPPQKVIPQRSRRLFLSDWGGISPADNLSKTRPSAASFPRPAGRSQVYPAENRLRRTGAMAVKTIGFKRRWNSRLSGSAAIAPSIHIQAMMKMRHRNFMAFKSGLLPPRYLPPPYSSAMEEALLREFYTGVRLGLLPRG